MKLLTTTIFAGLLFSASLPAGPIYYGEGQVPRPIDVARALAGQQMKPILRRRGMDLGNSAAEPVALGAPAPADPATAAPAETPVQTPHTEAAPGIAVAIPFAFDSAKLAPAAFPVLDSLAEGIKLTDPNARVLIVGHTDATGGENYNQSLSERRANSVRAYLMQQHGITGVRLQSSGLGEHQLLIPKQPANAKNRRVEFALG
jgi:outer membrane protein OmpA-like peptidoglycan-associated protein